MAFSSSKPNSAGATAAGSAASSEVPNLGTILRHFIGLDLTIELKNGRIYRGQLQEADDYMNLVIRKIDKENENDHSHQMQKQNMHQDRQQNDNHHDNDIDFLMVHIRGPSIRYIHFPANADLPRLVKLGLDRVKTAKDKYERGKRFSFSFCQCLKFSEFLSIPFKIYVSSLHNSNRRRLAAVRFIQSCVIVVRITSGSPPHY